MPEGTVERMRDRLQAALAPQRLAIEDDSARHAGHAGAAGGGGHYRLHLVSRKFEGLSRQARHRLVYDSLGEMMRRDVHALSMVLLAPDEAGASSPPTSGK